MGHLKGGSDLTQILKDLPRDFPGGPVIKNPPCDAGDTGSIPGQGTKIPHTTEKLSPRTTTRESTTKDLSRCKDPTPCN